ncbi:hypothetical protein VKT23_006834 [Stygiomarasmius scandens]|uniref:No apical meristem-associated C-terminal domain-containing protein n=1 Tax=Marasmiellus scandens TaxID=2682957 RepID=A0ABR1JLL2_9AGAR
MAKNSSEPLQKQRGRPPGSKNKTPAGKPSTQNARKKKTDAIELSSDSEEDDNKTKRPRIKWTDDLTETMLKELTDNPEIKQGLFPGPGTVGKDVDGNTVTKSNTLAKADYQYMLAEALFAHERFKYKASFDKDKMNAKGRAWWAGKIKSKLEELVGKVKECKKMMGETGEGLTSEEQIDMSQENALTTAWSKVKKICPQYFTLLPIIGERPNITPVGLGNTDEPIETSFLLSQKKFTPAPTSDFDSDNELAKVDFGDSLEDEESNISDEDTLALVTADGMNEKEVEKPTEALDTHGKRKHSDIITDDDIKHHGIKQQHGPKKNKSKKVEKPVSVKKGSNMFDKFAEVSKEEERSRQKKIELQQMRVSMEQELAKEKIRVAGATKVDRERIRADYELKKMKMQQEHEYRMLMAQTNRYTPHASHDSGNYSPRPTPPIPVQIELT